MRQRGVDRALVEECLRDPDRVLRDEDTFKCVKRLDGRVLVVVYRLEGRDVLVIMDGVCLIEG